MWREILSVLLIVSFVLIFAYPFWGFVLLFLVLFCLIWAIPETTTKKFKNKTEEMLEKGYVFNVETGEWEKPKKS